MDISVLTIFPELFNSFWGSGIVRKAVDMGKVDYSIHCIRDFASGSYRATDKKPFGGGYGMLMKPEPVVAAIKASKNKMPSSTSVVFLSPQGKKLDQTLALNLSRLKGLIFVCGRYEGIDERVLDLHSDFEISVGDYILTGGELPAMVVIDSLIRLIPGVLGNPSSACNDTFSNGLLEHAQYTRPRSFENKSVPKVLTSGNHDAIKKWKIETSLVRTFLKRKDLLEKKHLTPTELEILNKWRLDLEYIIQKQSM